VSKEQSKLVIALPKGRIMDESIEILGKAGLRLERSADKRALIHYCEDANILEMRNNDVATYVDLGVADVGIVGKDVLLESGRNVYEPVDLNFQNCRMSLITANGFKGEITRVASKYPNSTLRYLKEKRINAEVIPLKGQVELACLTGLADAVVDIVQTGSTLKANDLVEVDVLFESSARFIVNRAALKLREKELRNIIDSLREQSVGN